MAMTQFAMVEELASLIKDNLFSKHLVLSTEEALVNFIQDDTSPQDVLELKPMSSYNRLLLHRLADIYGFAHDSIGEGEDRHLVLERCPETAIPSILVSDILWQYGEYQSPSSPQHILRRKGSSATRPTEPLPSPTFDERKATYLAARHRIFSLHETDEEEAGVPKSRNVPVVARRMIEHALGQKLCTESSNQWLSMQKCVRNGVSNTATERVDAINSTPSTKNSAGSPVCKLGGRSRSSHSTSASRSSSDRTVLASESNRSVVGCESMEKEQRGAAKRIFANALGTIKQGKPSPQHES